MEMTRTQRVFKWFEDVLSHGDANSDKPSVENSTASLLTGLAGSLSGHPFWKDDLEDIHLGLESFVSDGDRVTCAMVVKAHHKTSGEPVAFRSRLDGRVEDGRLVETSTAVEDLLAG